MKRTVYGSPQNGNPTPAAQKLKGWTFDPACCGNQIGATSGFMFVGKILVPTTVLVTNVLAYASTAGSGLTSGQNFLGLYDSAGNQLGVSADQSTPFASTGLKTAALGAPVTVTGGASVFVYAALLAKGTTVPSFAYSALAIGALISAGLAAADGVRSGYSSGGLSAMPASFTPSALTLAVPFWLGLS